MTGLLRAELVKLRATRTVWLLAAGAVLASLAVAALQLGLDTDPAAGTLRWGGTAERFSGADDVAELLDIVPLIGLVAMLLGALALPTEVRYQTIASTFLASPSRLRILAAKATVSAAVAALIAAAAQWATLALAGAWLLAAGADVPLDGGVAQILLLAPAASALAAVLGVGVGAALRQQVAAVLAVVGWVLIVEQLLAGLLPAVQPSLPFTGAVTALGGGGTAALAVGSATAVLVGYCAVSLAVGGLLLVKRDLA